MVKVDKNLCTGCGVCVNVCPEGFEIRNGKSVVRDPNAPCIFEAMSACPVGAIILEGERVPTAQALSRAPKTILPTIFSP